MPAACRPWQVFGQTPKAFNTPVQAAQSAQSCMSCMSCHSAASTSYNWIFKACTLPHGSADSLLPSASSAAAAAACCSFCRAWSAAERSKSCTHTSGGAPGGTCTHNAKTTYSQPQTQSYPDNARFRNFACHSGCWKSAVSCLLRGCRNNKNKQHMHSTLLSPSSESACMQSTHPALQPHIVVPIAQPSQPCEGCEGHQVLRFPC